MKHAEKRFDVLSFLGDNKLFIAGTIITGIFFTLVLKVMAVSQAGIVVIDGVLLVAAVAYLIVNYMRRVSFWRALEECAGSLDRVSHLTDLLDEPHFLEGEIAYESLQTISNLANSEITAFQIEDQENSEYINMWVHEVKTPLATARLSVEGMHGSDALVIKRELERIETLIQQALYAARSKSFTQDYLIREVRLVDIVSEASKSNMHYLMSLNVGIDVQVDPNCCVYADKQWLGFIVTQLLTNSAKYGAKTITITATIPKEESSLGATILEIKDDGCGIPAEDVPRVFERGFTGSVGREHGSATGMGLYLAARMCNQMGIGIQLASEEGVGTRVELFFPHDRRRINLTNM